MTIQAWVIGCRVSGGVTGTRESKLQRNGAVIHFRTEAEAKAEAKRLNAAQNNMYATAFFQYWVEEVQVWEDNDDDCGDDCGNCHGCDLRNL